MWWPGDGASWNIARRRALFRRVPQYIQLRARTKFGSVFRLCSTKPSFFCPHLHTINANMLSYVNYRTFSLASHLFIENGKEKEPAVCRMLKEAWSMRVKVLKADYISTYLQQSMKAEDEQKYVVKKFS